MYYYYYVIMSFIMYSEWQILSMMRLQYGTASENKKTIEFRVKLCLSVTFSMFLVQFCDLVSPSL